MSLDARPHDPQTDHRKWPVRSRDRGPSRSWRYLFGLVAWLSLRRSKWVLSMLVEHPQVHRNQIASTVSRRISFRRWVPASTARTGGFSPGSVYARRSVRTHPALSFTRGRGWGNLIRLGIDGLGDPYTAIRSRWAFAKDGPGESRGCVGLASGGMEACGARPAVNDEAVCVRLPMVDVVRAGAEAAGSGDCRCAGAHRLRKTIRHASNSLPCQHDFRINTGRELIRIEWVSGRKFAL